MPPILRFALGPVAIAAAIALATPAAAQRIGVSSAVNPATTGAPPGGTARQLVIGENIVYNEHIATGAAGQTQILFVDESTISVGPNSDMTIDKFVYDPKTGTGTEALSATRGVFRYVGGKLSKEANAVSITTPVATIGIRGGAFQCEMGPQGLTCSFLYGKGLQITGLNGVSELITRPGWAVTVPSAGASPTSPVPAKNLRDANFRLDGRRGGTGGAQQTPTDSTVADSGIGNTISGNVLGSFQQAQNQTQWTPPPQPPTNTQNNFNQNTVATQQGLQQGNGPPQGPTTPNETGLAGGFTGINTETNQNGFTNQLTPYANGVVQNGVFITTIGGDQVSFPLAQGTGTLNGIGTTSPVGPFVGTTFQTPDNTFFYANLALQSDPSKIGFIYGGKAVNPSVYAATGSPQFLAFQIQPDGALQSPVPFVTNQFGGAIAGPEVSPLFVAVSPTTGFAYGDFNGDALPKALQATLAINGQGAAQSSLLMVTVGNIFSEGLPVLNGVSEGAYSPSATGTPTINSTAYITGVDGNGNSFYGNNSITGFVVEPSCCAGPQQSSLATAINSQTGQTTTYGFVQPVIATTAPPIASGPQTTQTLSGYFGGIMTPYSSQNLSPYAVIGATSISTDATNLQIAATLAGGDPFTSRQSGAGSVVLSFGSLSPGDTNARQGYINDNLFGVLESPGGSGSSLNGNGGTAVLYLVDSNAVPTAINNLLPVGVTACSCQYLQWGYWGGELTTESESGTRNDVATINTWVAGTPTPQTDINNLISMSATGSYSGAAIGSVFNNGATYVAAGGFTQSYNFGTQTGTLQISNFDGNRNFGGTIVGVPGTANFAGALSGSNLSGSAIGSFYGPGAAETGGSFAVQALSGTPYRASGIFAGPAVSLPH
jgi:trimeric autotransporter adhesin